MYCRLPTHRHWRTSAPRRKSTIACKIQQPLDSCCLSLFVSGSITVRKRLPAAAGREVDTGPLWGARNGLDWRFQRCAFASICQHCDVTGRVSFFFSRGFISPYLCLIQPRLINCIALSSKYKIAGRGVEAHVHVVAMTSSGTLLLQYWVLSTAFC